jgi:hypothetical protein
MHCTLQTSKRAQQQHSTLQWNSNMQEIIRMYKLQLNLRHPTSAAAVSDLLCHCPLASHFLLD